MVVKRWWKPLLCGVDLELRQGVTALVGPAGAGKTLLLRALLGLERPAEGTVEVLGERLPGAGARVRTRVGYVAQDLALYPGLTPIELAELHGELHAIWHVEELFQRLARWQVPAREPVERLAPLPRALLALGLALAHAPSLLLVDLPTALDAAGRAYLLDAVAGERGALPVVLASARPHELEERCDRVVLLVAGRVRRDGAPAALAEGLLRLDLEGQARPVLPPEVKCLRAGPGPRGARWWVAGSPEGLAAAAALPGVVLSGPPGFEEAYLARVAEAAAAP
ncbi:MAG: ATP-binding cassette domain-containing protein [Planctomycetota bacterium]